LLSKNAISISDSSETIEEATPPRLPINVFLPRACARLSRMRDCLGPVYTARSQLGAEPSPRRERERARMFTFLLARLCANSARSPTLNRRPSFAGRVASKSRGFVRESEAAARENLPGGDR